MLIPTLIAVGVVAWLLSQDPASGSGGPPPNTAAVADWAFTQGSQTFWPNTARDAAELLVQLGDPRASVLEMHARSLENLTPSAFADYALSVLAGMIAQNPHAERIAFIRYIPDLPPAQLENWFAALVVDAANTPPGVEKNEFWIAHKGTTIPITWSMMIRAPQDPRVVTDLELTLDEAP